MKRESESIGWIGPRAAGLADHGASPRLDPARFGEKAARLAAAAALDLPVPPGFVLDAATAADPRSASRAIDVGLARLEAATGCRLGDPERPLLLAVRPSAAPGAMGQGGSTGGGAVAPSVLNLGVCAATRAALAHRLGPRGAADLARRLAQGWGAGVAGLDGEEFEFALHDALRATGADCETDLGAEALDRLAADCRRLAEGEGHPLPDAPRAQLDAAVAGLARAWRAPRAARRRLARGGTEGGGLAVIVQVMALGLSPAGGASVSGAGIAALRDEDSGAPCVTGRFLANSQGEEATLGLRAPQVLTLAEREVRGLDTPSLEEIAPEAVAALAEAGRRLEAALGEAFALDLTLEDGRLAITELRLARRSARAAVRLSVDLAEMGAIAREDALLRVDPSALEAHLHPTIDPAAARDVVARGLPASPGAASGPLVFTPEDAEAAAAAGRAAILALVETSPEDIRGMHAARAVLTVRGGMTSHAAVVARGLGKPCVVGARGLRLDRRAPDARHGSRAPDARHEGRASDAPHEGNASDARYEKRVPCLMLADGRVFGEGEVITVDGGAGEVIAGHVATRPPELTGAFARLMAWADDARRLGVRANADTGQDARVAVGLAAEGIGLCRTEHMFFPSGRISAVRRMILATTAEDRRAALAELQPMQRSDFETLFRAMPGQPVVIRLLDPPLHEFLPHGAHEIAELGRALGLPEDEVQARARELAEFNPMLGKRGCRVGIAYPEIYEMQARAIFEAALDASEDGRAVVPEIMIPLISAVRELEVLRGRIDAVAGAVRAERGAVPDYRVGVMIETPRACLRAGEIARLADFISFGTNDLTQMTYGLSRDDAGRFMPDYVAQGIFAHDPFHSLDLDGVGEMVHLAAERARRAKPGISLGLCGEHGADGASVAFCEDVGLDYVSCSPYRVPIARLASAQAAIRRAREAALS